MKEIAKVLLFNKNNDAKWDERLDLETCALCENSCMIGLVKLSNRKVNTKKIIEMVYKRMSINIDVELKLYIDPRLIDRLVMLDNYPLIIREPIIIGGTWRNASRKKYIPTHKRPEVEYKEIGKKIIDMKENEDLKQISKIVGGHGL